MFVNEHTDSTLFALSLVGLTWYFSVLSLGLVGCWTARRRYRLEPSPPRKTVSSQPGVSILRPLKGLDPNLYENLESTFIQEYSNYEIIFSVADEEDQALTIVHELISKYGNVPATVIIGEEIVGVNPKVNNLVRPYHHAVNDILWVLDSNVMVQCDTLTRSVGVMVSRTVESSSSGRVGLIHHVPFASASDDLLGSKVERTFLNTNHAKMYIAINALGLDSCVVGKSNLYRRSDVECLTGLSPPQITESGLGGVRGLPAFGRFLAEDNALASAIWHELCLRHNMSCDVAYTSVGDMSMSDYFSRRIRWIRVRKHMVLTATVLEPFTEAFVLAVIASMSFKSIFGLPTWLTPIIHFTLWILVDLDVNASLAGHPLKYSMNWEFIGLWFVREFLAFPVYVFAIFGSDVVWRSNRYRLYRNGEAIKSQCRNHTLLDQFLRPKNGIWSKFQL